VREAQVISTLEHPNIVRMFDSGEQNGKYYMVMEYISGKDLDHLLNANGTIPLVQALSILKQVAGALDYAHARGYVHRDIKPSNVILDGAANEQRAVLTDFGIAKIVDARTVMTRTGYMLGTFSYIAPEQIEESSNVDGRADIYALGVMAFQMLTGQLPFTQNNPGALLIAHMTQPPPDASLFVPDLPSTVSMAIQKAMSKKPADRFLTASEFITELE
jgi:serine/threonine-protein kinase